MTPITVTSMSVMCFLLASGIGLWLGQSLPLSEWSRETQELVKESRRLVVGIATLSLSLILAWATTSFNERQNEIENSASKIVGIDSTLSKLGTKADGSREMLHSIVEKGIVRIDAIATDGFGTEATRKGIGINKLQLQILDLTSDNQREEWLKSSALGLVKELAQYKWLQFSGANGSIQSPVLIIMIIWISIIFLSYGMVSPLNWTGVTTLLVVSGVTSSVIFVIMDLDSTSGGLIQSISSEPLKAALQQIDAARIK
ncbi:hypothetical protein LBMAG20_15180 [Methylocystaceae bacterium]|jgi:hypothetical protein|nr:hypothetical protein LBMAG20_15180 [Methylocystaceae bacterium]